jgi:hypothetical protein
MRTALRWRACRIGKGRRCRPPIRPPQDRKDTAGYVREPGRRPGSHCYRAGNAGRPRAARPGPVTARTVRASGRLWRPVRTTGYARHQGPGPGDAPSQRLGLPQHPPAGVRMRARARSWSPAPFASWSRAPRSGWRPGAPTSSTECPAPGKSSQSSAENPPGTGGSGPARPRNGTTKLTQAAHPASPRYWQPITDRGGLRRARGHSGNRTESAGPAKAGERLTLRGWPSY